MSDTDVDNTKITMPAMEALAVDTIDFLIAEPYISSVMKLPRPVLNELGRRLLEPGVETSKVIEWVHTKKADLPQRNIYRFALRFREAYKTVWASWADKVLLAELAANEDFQVDDYQRLIKNRVTTLIAQEVMTSSPTDLDTSRLNAVLSLITAADKGQLEREKLLIMQGQAEHRAAKLLEEVEKLRLENEQRKAAIKAQAKAAQQAVEEAAEAAKSGASGDEVVKRVRELLGMPTKGEAA